MSFQKNELLKETIPIFSLKLYLFVYCECVYVCSRVCVRKGAVCHDACVGVGGHHGGVNSLPVPGGSWDGAQVGRLGGKGLRSLCHTAAPKSYP